MYFLNICRITSAFKKKFGEKAGWAHQILFAGDLSTFKSKVETQNKKKRKYDEMDS